MAGGFVDPRRREGTLVLPGAFVSALIRVALARGAFL